MNSNQTVVAVFTEHDTAESAVKKLVDTNFDMKRLSVIGKGFHTEEKVVGFYNAGDRVTLWGTRGAFWGGLWGLFFGGVLITVPLIGPIVLLGSAASMVISGIEGAAIVGGMSALAAALFGFGIPKDSVIEYETAVKSDCFLVMVDETADDIALAHAILDTVAAASLNIHSGKLPAKNTAQFA